MRASVERTREKDVKRRKHTYARKRERERVANKEVTRATLHGRADKSMNEQQMKGKRAFRLT